MGVVKSIANWERIRRNGPRGVIEVRAWENEVVELEAGATHFIICANGPTNISLSDKAITLQSRATARVSECASLELGSGIVISQYGYEASMVVSQPHSWSASKEYISGNLEEPIFSDARDCDPSLNLLHLPPSSVDQPLHTHPDIRVGLITGGSVPLQIDDQIFAAKKNDVVLIEENELHGFKTPACDCFYLVYHPAVSLVEKNHGAIMNNTYIDGIQASQLEEYHTKKGAASGASSEKKEQTSENEIADLEFAG